MGRVRPILEDLRSSTDAIVDRWDRRVRTQPWLSLPEEARIDHVPEMVETLIAALLGEPSVEEGRERAVRMAVKHGRHRREQGLNDEVIHREHHLLRSAIWDVIRERHGRKPACFEAIALIDVATTMTTTGSLHGFHQDGQEERESSVGRIAEDGPWPEPV